MEKTIEHDMETSGISGFMDMELTHGYKVIREERKVRCKLLFRVEGLGFGIEGLGFRIEGLGVVQELLVANGTTRSLRG